MNNKIFYSVIVAIILVFGGVFYFMSQKEETSENLSKSGYYPYTDKEPSELQGPTKEVLDDENYQFNFTPDEANKKIENEDEVFVYLWSPVCEYCKMATPLLIDSKNTKDFNLVQVNVLEYPEFMQQHKGNVTPTLIYFNDGKEVERAEGAPEKAEDYTAWIKAAQEQ
ncbi:thioredoxin family protein [Phocicoccus pinnipedialis]|uniref:Thioredoxin 2 n=1 Tax=Phocicoccus pinnipedialis TaxID=110845 RepID=A0A6V7RMU0_9BACL|nr:thioredoxin family protein [Jeotgalicoccus pinnipedialis]MBP1939609.1 thiol-disulfide isomerase/thioredoxin [Jeotgalicoccus pinnipedialis]CAD2079010.1 thioredoxin 2 [Jeotgalicoccus pinnipedialis]